MKRNTLILCTLLMVSSISGCNKGENHEHTFNESWEASPTHHWHSATCEHLDLTSSLGEHTFDDDGKCTICGYKVYTVTYLNWPLGIENPNPTTADINTNINLEAYTILENPGFSNVKFFIDSDEVTSLTSIDKDVVVNVSYDVTTTTVTLVPNNGVDESTEIEVNYWDILDNLTSEYTKDEHTLIGWFDDYGNKVDTSKPWTITESAFRLTAKWKYDEINQLIDSYEFRCQAMFITIVKSGVLNEKIDSYLMEFKMLVEIGKNALLDGDYSKEEALAKLEYYQNYSEERISDKARRDLLEKLDTTYSEYCSKIPGNQTYMNALESIYNRARSRVQNASPLNYLLNIYKDEINEFENIYKQYAD